MSSDPTHLRVALVQYPIVMGEPEENFATIRELLFSQVGQGVDLFILPEVCLTGFGGGRNTPAYPEDDWHIQSFIELAREVDGTILAGFRIRENEESFNRALVINGNGIEARYDKRVLFSYWKEHELFSEGDEPLHFSMKGFDIASYICYELRFPELFRRQLGAQLMTVIANWPLERRHHWLTLLQARAIENQCYVAGVNRTGDAKGIPFVGDSVLFDPYGKPVLELHSEVACRYVDLDFDLIERYRAAFPVLDDAKRIQQ